MYVSEDEYQNIYAQQQQQQQQVVSKPRDYRPAVTTVRPLSRASHASTTLAPRTKINEEKTPPVQTIRNYNKVNDDGSFTFGKMMLLVGDCSNVADQHLELVLSTQFFEKKSKFKGVQFFMFRNIWTAPKRTKQMK